MLPKRSLFSRSSPALLLALAPCALAACGPTAIDADPRVLHHEPAAQTASEDPLPPTIDPIVEAPAPREPWLGVVASRGTSGVLAAWSASRVVVSRDDGRHYHTVLDGKGNVDAVAMGDDGTLFVLRKGFLGVVKRSGATDVRPMPFAKTTSQLVAGAGALAWIGEKAEGDGAVVLGITRDDGTSWVFPSGVPALGDYENRLLIDESGAMRLVVSNEADCGGGYQSRYVGDLASGAWREAGWPVDAPGAWGLGADGWSYAIADCGTGVSGHLCGIDPEGKARALAPVQASTFEAWRFVSNGRATWATLDGKLAWLSGGVVLFPARATPRGFALAAVDAEGQPIGIAQGHAMRWGRDGKWHAILGH